LFDSKLCENALHNPNSARVASWVAVLASWPRRCSELVYASCLSTATANYCYLNTIQNPVSQGASPGVVLQFKGFQHRGKHFPFPLFQIPVSGTPPIWVVDSQAPLMTWPMISSHASGSSSGRSSSTISEYEIMHKRMGFAIGLHT